MKSDVFKKELELIENKEIRKLVKKLINQLPKYFFEIPASSTGKYHPQYTLGEGGLVRHTRAAVTIANELLNLDMYKSVKKKKDVVIGALLLHDGLKKGLKEEKYTCEDHPVLIHDFILKKFPNNEVAKEISGLVLTHMGQWNKSYKEKKPLFPVPKTNIQKFVHLCDYLASRKCLEVSLEEV